MKTGKNHFIFCIVVISLLCSSCATIINGRYQKVQVHTIPDSCELYLNGENTNLLTPCTLKVKRNLRPTVYNAANEQHYVLKKEGYSDFEIKDKSRFSPVIFGNVGVGLGTYGALLSFEHGLTDDIYPAGSAGSMVLAGLIDLFTGSTRSYQKRVFAELKTKPGKVTISAKKENITPTDITGSGKRIALCIGNGDYSNASQLINPINDAGDMASSLEKLGFEVIKLENGSQVDMKKAIDEFGVKLKKCQVGLFFYAGHGVQAKGENYLIPIDANISSENDVEYNCVSANRVLAKMEDAGSIVNIVILDACRNNPFERSWTRSTKGRGLIAIDAPVGSLIAFATSPGNTASDGTDRNGLYTSALLEYINEPGISILEMFQKVRKTVRENSNGEQVPWESTSLEGNFYFSK